MKNGEYCKIAGISLEEMNRLELIFVSAMDYELGINNDAAICRRITRMLSPPKISNGILMSDKTSRITKNIHRLSPDTAVDLEDCDDISDFDDISDISDEEISDFQDRLKILGN
eukprot:CAMPEP_0119054342 /NCGR_PEP_ID=MMETSP1177-20130426/75005_1 /TAXON_ID=2985 /ORGANISM="Ochromonas sp, Strain CCMP1899" /LENGTH=113 /DNA_ID=CAMNT_0007034543 /DNA_START=382 /DNA_END=723 /DNA_ORIENTATION=-